jgi:uncharacterized protein YuzE
MDDLKTLLPDVVLQLEAALGKNRDFVEQLRTARISRVTFDPDAPAGYIYVRTGRELNVVERNIIGTKHGHTMEVPGGLWMNIDLDNFERLTGIEILAPPSEMAVRLSELSQTYR